MNSIKDLLPGSMRERTFQLKARRDAVRNGLFSFPCVESA